jgi:hypothetical protein
MITADRPIPVGPVDTLGMRGVSTRPPANYLAAVLRVCKAWLRLAFGEELQSRRRATHRHYRRPITPDGPQERHRLVAEQRELQPICMRCFAQEAVDVHERLSRGRGGSILDKRNLVSLCRTCNTWITEHPVAAEGQGWALNSASKLHEFDPDDVGFYCTVWRLPRMNQRHREQVPA